MLANVSDKSAAEIKALETAAPSAEVGWSGRLLMIALNFIPMLHAAATAILLLSPYASLPRRIGVALAFLYFAPPLTARFILALVAIPEGHVAVGTRAFFSWWMLFQLQVVFCRLPALEEILRLIPGLYSQWLRLWGAKLGRFTYWSPGTMITDRSFLRIGNDVVLGAGVRLNPHVLARNKEGRMELLLAHVTIGDRAMVGGYSLLTAGTEISPDEVTRAYLLSPPFSLWKDGKRIRSEPGTEIE